MPKAGASFEQGLQAARNGCRVLFLRPAADGERFELSFSAAAGFAGQFLRLLQGVDPDGRIPDAADVLNELARLQDRGSLREQLYSTLFSALAAAGVIPGRPAKELSPDAEFLLREARNIAVFPDLLWRELKRRKPAYLTPKALDFLAGDGEIGNPAGQPLAEFAAEVARFDNFGSGRALRYLDGKFIPANLEKIRAVDRFYGFPGVRRLFREQFQAFAGGEPRVPLLVSSLPGHGKTQLTIAHALHHGNLTLVLAGADALGTPLEQLIAELKTRPDRRFVVFFDDVDPRILDWYTFRTHVGGSFLLPDHIMLVLSSNFRFPPEIQSRGLSVLFPTFDDIRCQEMVEDFLCSCGFRAANPNLVSLISAEFTEEFGQRRFSELSPRTLIRHLELYENSRQKRRDAVQLACGPMVTRPDPQLFYEFNIKLMRSLYGNEFIENMLKEKLRDL